MGQVQRWVSELVEYISYGEYDLRNRKESLAKKLIDLRIACDAWKETTAGKKMQRQKAKRTRLRKAMKDLCRINSISGVSEGPAASAIQGLIQDLDQFITEDVPLPEDFCEAPLDEAAESEVSEGAVEEQCPSETLQEPEVPGNGNNVQAKISEIKQKLIEVDNVIARKEKVFLHSVMQLHVQTQCLPRHGRQSLYSSLHGVGPVTA